jgi:hypothetical protein
VTHSSAVLLVGSWDPGPKEEDGGAHRCWFRREGVLRSYSKVNGRRCDTVMYALIRSGLVV